MEVLSVEVAADLVSNGAVFMGLRKVVELAVCRGGTLVPLSDRKGSPSLKWCFGCRNRGHVKRFCLMWAGGGSKGGVVGRCWGCGGCGH